ncbi:hypothetical protein [Escherichia coli]|uniref:hypothetical protein n=1 Tax=Escherichia coli TaxID=562 RepID=UPI0017EF5791|nr:hypothetical protein [Escherichia coli]EGE1181547.1 hypothetical protein [Escherichia coli]MBC0427864.1 hypothetical protein [Escherichia coli]HAH7007263.1 hypothetical protein [Escherichia coli]HAM9853403.1 hypothetical protein [Escherichia coli]
MKNLVSKNRMNTKRNVYKIIFISMLKCCFGCTFAIYVGLLGVSVYLGFKFGVFDFDFYGDFIISLKKGLLLGGVYGMREAILWKAKVIGKE